MLKFEQEVVLLDVYDMIQEEEMVMVESYDNQDLDVKETFRLHEIKNG